MPPRGKKRSIHTTLPIWQQKHQTWCTGIIVRSDTKCTFVPVNDRLCKLTIKKEQSNIVIISAYTPTLELSIKHPEKSEKFYDELESLIHTVKTREF